MLPVIPLLEVNQEVTFNHIADQLATQGFCLMPSTLAPNCVTSLRNFAKKKGEEGAFRVAGIGKMHQFNIDKSIRGDAILWLDEDQENDYILQVESFIDDLRNFLNRTCYLGLRDSEMHLANYKPGTFYKRHADRFNQSAHRHISFVFYLNKNWQPGDGGELKIYLPNNEEATIEPRGGSLIIFRSELEHEVLMAHKSRYSLTGWMLDIDKKLTFL